MKIRIFLLTFICWAIQASAAEGVVRDRLVRDYITPTRIVWMETDSVIRDAEALLQDGDGQAPLGKARVCRILNKERSSILLDFGQEIQGGLQIVTGTGSQMTANMRIRFGESVGEACSETVNNSNGVHGYSTNDHSQRDIITTVSRYGTREIGNTGFRFVLIDFLDPGLRLDVKEVRAVARYRDLPYTGFFRSSDPRLDSIWQIAARTVHLNMQEYLWDGIKRDRCIWIGDMHPEVQTIMTVFDDTEVVEATLDNAVAQYPLPSWLNGMSSYSFWYLIIHHDWFMHHGDAAFLDRHYDYIKGLIRQIDSRIDADGNEEMNPGMTSPMGRFLDWPSSPNRPGVEAGYRALMSWGLNSAEKLAVIRGDSETAAICHDAQTRLRKKIMPDNGLPQAKAIMSVAGWAEPEQAAGLDVQDFSTFYGYYMLEALARNGQYQKAIDIIRTYWGAMLDLGATSLWEDFHIEWLDNAARIDRPVPEGKTDVHGSYGDYCYNGYRHSLCHGWASGPCPWLTRHVLGIEILEPGCRTVRIRPNLGDLEFAEGAIPTPYGPLQVFHTRNADGTIRTNIQAPQPITILR